MFYIVENNVCLYITPTMKDANDWMKKNNKTVYKVYQDEYKKIIVKVTNDVKRMFIWKK